MNVFGKGRSDWVFNILIEFLFLIPLLVLFPFGLQVLLNFLLEIMIAHGSIKVCDLPRLRVVPIKVIFFCCTKLLEVLADLTIVCYKRLSFFHF